MTLAFFELHLRLFILCSFIILSFVTLMRLPRKAIPVAQSFAPLDYAETEGEANLRQ